QFRAFQPQRPPLRRLRLRRRTVRRAALRLVLALAALGAPAAALAQTGDGARHRTSVIPYIEAAQVLTQELEPGNDTVTYTSLAAGVDATVAGRNSAASVSLRY